MYIDRVVSNVDPSRKVGLLPLPVAPSVSSVSAVGLNHSAIRITVTLEYRGSVQPISFQVNYEGAVAGATTSGSRLFNDVQLDGLTWSGVVSGLTEFEAYVLTVTPMSSEGQGRSLKTTPTYPKPGTVQCNE